MKILLILPKQYHIYGKETQKPRLPPIGIAYLSAFLKQEGHDVCLHDCTAEGGTDGLWGPLLSSSDVIGISLYSLNISASYGFVDEIKSFLRAQTKADIPVILGGPHVTVVGREVLEKTGADFAIRGEGEQTFLALLNELQQGRVFQAIDGLMWRDSENQIIENRAREFLRDIDALPFPDYSIFKLDRYMSQDLNEVPLLTSRGCPFHCRFCAVKLVAGQRYRPRSPENVCQEIAGHYARGVRQFYINDDLFNFDVARAETVCDLIIKRGYEIKFIFQNGVRADRLPESLVKKLKRAGCQLIVLSAESGNPDILKSIRKKISISDIKAAVETLEEVGIPFIVNFIVGHPTETYAQGRDSLRLAEELAKKKRCVTVMFFNLIPYPATEVFEWVERHGTWLIAKDKYLDSGMLDSQPVFETAEFPVADRMRLLRAGERLHRRKLLEFIFGKPVGLAVYMISSVDRIKQVFLRFAFNRKLGQDKIYKRFLKKIYQIR